MTQFQRGDLVTHNPTGEECKISEVLESDVVLGHWPRWLARAKDCTLICGCATPEERADCNRPCDTVVE